MALEKYAQGALEEGFSRADYLGRNEEVWGKGGNAVCSLIQAGLLPTLHYIHAL